MRVKERQQLGTRPAERVKKGVGDVLAAAASVACPARAQPAPERVVRRAAARPVLLQSRARWRAHCDILTHMETHSFVDHHLHHLP